MPYYPLEMFLYKIINFHKYNDLQMIWLIISNENLNIAVFCVLCCLNTSLNYFTLHIKIVVIILSQLNMIQLILVIKNLIHFFLLLGIVISIHIKLQYFKFS